MLCKADMKKEEGMTLMELIIAITFLAVIASAAYYGMQYAFVTMSAAGEYAEELYERQHEFEDSLSYDEGNVPFDLDLYPGSQDQDEYDLIFILDNPTYTVDFLARETGLSSGNYNIVSYTWTDTTTSLDNFNSHGVTYHEDAEGGTYLSDLIYVFIPTNTIEIP